MKNHLVLLLFTSQNKRVNTLFFIVQNFRTYYVRNFSFCQILLIISHTSLVNSQTNIRSEHTFLFHVHYPRPSVVKFRVVGSCDGAAAGRRPGAAVGSCETSCGVRPQNLTFKIKFLWSCVVVKI